MDLAHRLLDQFYRMQSSREGLLIPVTHELLQLNRDLQNPEENMTELRRQFEQNMTELRRQFEREDGKIRPEGLVLGFEDVLQIVSASAEGRTTPSPAQIPDNAIALLQTFQRGIPAASACPPLLDYELWNFFEQVGNKKDKLLEDAITERYDRLYKGFGLDLMTLIVLIVKSAVIHDLGESCSSDMSKAEASAILRITEGYIKGVQEKELIVDPRGNLADCLQQRYPGCDLEAVLHRLQTVAGRRVPYRTAAGVAVAGLAAAAIAGVGYGAYKLRKRRRRRS